MLCMCVINHVKCTQFTLMVIKREEQLVTEGCGSACTTQTKFASKPSPEWIQDFSVTISGGSEIRGGLLNYFSIHKIILQNWFLRLHTYSAIIAKMYVCVSSAGWILSESHTDWKSNVISMWGRLHIHTAHDDDDNELRLLWLPENNLQFGSNFSATYITHPIAYQQ